MRVTTTTLAALAVMLGAALRPATLSAQEERQRRNLFGMHTLNSGDDDFGMENLEWTQHLVGRGWVFDYPRNGNYEALVEKAFELNLIPCIRVQEGEAGELPDAGAASVVAERILNYKIAHPQYADRLVYLQLWNEPNDARDFVPPEAYADYLVEAHNLIHQAEAGAAAAHPALGLLGTLKTMTPGQNGPSWWDRAFRHNPDAKFAFDVWGTHPYPEAAPPHYNHHDGDVFIETTKTIDSYLLDLDVVAQPHGSPARTRRGFPVMITETAYGDKLGIAYEGWPKTNRALAAAYNADAFAHRWYRWPELLAAHPFLLHHPAWERFAWVPGSSCGAPATPGCSSQPRCSQECNGDGVREPKSPHPQYTAVREARLSLESQGMAPARLTPFRGQTGRIRGRVTRADTGAVVPYATVRTDGYAFGHVSLYDGHYEIHDVPAGSYSLTVERNGYRATSRAITLTAGQTVSADFALVYTGRVSKGVYYVDSPPHPGCPGCSLFDRVLGQTFTTPAEVAFVKYAAAKPNVDAITLEFSILSGGPTGPQVGSSITATLEAGDGANMIGAEWPDGQEPPLQPNQTYFLKIERADGQGLYAYASNANPYGGGQAYVGGQPRPGVDFVAVIRGLTAAVNTATGNLTGIVRDTSGVAIAGATVSADPGGRSAATDAAGRYTIAGITVGTYQVTASKSGFVSASVSGAELRPDATTTLDFTLSAGASTGDLRGRVTDASGQPLLGAELAATPGGRLATTDASGGYLLDGLAAETYSVAARKAGYTPQTRAGVSVAGGQITTLDFQLAAIVVAPAPTIANPDFEDDRGFFTVARGFTRFGGNKWEAVWDPVRVFTQGVADVPPTSRAGVFQTIAVTARTRYRVTVQAKVTGAGYEAAVGVDPAGGTNPGAAVFGAASTSASWSPVSWEFEATGPAATIFLGAWNTRSSFVAGWVQFDGVTIESLGSGNQPPTIPPPSAKSKLSIHAGWGGNTDHFLRNAKPRVVKLLDEVSKAAIVKQLSPGTIVVGRLFPGSVPDGVIDNGSPVDRANDWWSTVKAAVLAYPDVDYWEGLNEPVVTSAATMSWYAQFEIARTNILAANGRKAVIANFATGNPDLALWPQFIPAIDNALAKGGIMGLHEYGTPMRQYWEEPVQEGWLCGRYRKVYRQHLQGREIPLVITETGVDEGTLASTGPGQPKPRPDAQANHGWQQALGTPPVAGFPPPGDLAARKPWYMEQLRWYDGILKQDDYVLGATIYQLEIPGWGSFSVSPLLQELTDDVAQGASNAPPSVGLAVDQTTAAAPGSFVLTASASDPDGSISRVEFYEGATLLGTDTGSPYSFTWSSVPAGSYSLTAKAHDDAGASTASSAVSVSVTSTTPPAPPSGTDPGLVWLSDDMNAHAGGLVQRWSKWSTGTGSAEWNIVPGEGGWWAQEVKKSGVEVGISRPNRGFRTGDAYRLRFRARKTIGSGAPRCSAGVRSGAGAPTWGSPVLVSSTTSWGDVSYDFTASEASLTLLLRAELTGFSDVGVAFDNVAVELLSPRDPEPWMLSGAPPVEPLAIHGIHDTGAEDLFVEAGRKGWVTEALAIGSNPSDRSGRRFTQWIDGIGVVCRIAHLFGRILPDPGPAPQYPGLDAFAQRAANFVQSSVGCGIWSIGNEPHLEGVQDPALYAEAFARSYRAIKAVRPGARVISAGFVHGDLGYFRDALRGIEERGVLPDGIALHTYTDAQWWNEASFRDYRTKIANLPASMRQLPLYITEAGTGGPGNPTTNTGLVDAMFDDVHQWNASGGQQVRAVSFYRWSAGTDKWAIEANPGMRADFAGTLARDYRWFPAGAH